MVTETPTTVLIDAGGGLGQPVSYRAMEKAIEKAEASGTGFAAVRNSNHFGIAGYYAMMALGHDCIGISMTNAAVLVVPTFGRNAMLGTNPISMAAPAGEEWPFVLDKPRAPCLAASSRCTGNERSQSHWAGLPMRPVRPPTTRAACWTT